MKHLTPRKKQLVKLIGSLILLIVFNTDSLAQTGLDQAGTAMSGLLQTAYKFMTIIIAIIALVFAAQALGQIKQGKNEGWTKLMSIVLVVAIWLFALPPFINKVVEIGTGKAGNIENNNGKTL